MLFNNCMFSFSAISEGEDLFPVDLSWLPFKPGFPRKSSGTFPIAQEIANNRDWVRHDAVVRSVVSVLRKDRKLSVTDEDLARHAQHVDKHDGTDKHAEERRKIYDLPPHEWPGSEHEDRKLKSLYMVSHAYLMCYLFTHYNLFWCTFIFKTGIIFHHINYVQLYSTDTLKHDC
jgi:hypothetical protein